MVRHYKRKTDRFIDEKAMAAAVSDVLDNKIPMRKAAQKYNVKTGTLQFRIKNAKSLKIEEELRKVRSLMEKTKEQVKQDIRLDKNNLADCSTLSSDVDSADEDSTTLNNIVIKNDTNDFEYSLTISTGEDTQSTNQINKTIENIKINQPTDNKKNCDQIQRTDRQQDDIDAFGIYVESSLRKLSDENMICAQDEIQAVLTKYKLKNLKDSGKFIIKTEPEDN